MPMESVIFLAIVAVSLSVFAAALAYADWATRQVAARSTATAAPLVNAPKKPNTASAKPAPVHEMAA